MHTLFQNHTANKDVQIFMGHGGQDFLVPLSFGQMTEAYIKAFNPNITMKVYPRMAHSSCPEVSISHWFILVHSFHLSASLIVFLCRIIRIYCDYWCLFYILIRCDVCFMEISPFFCFKFLQKEFFLHTAIDEWK